MRVWTGVGELEGPVGIPSDSDEYVSDETTVAPLLRWAGGKRWLVPRLRAAIQRVGFDRYVEPFVGGGSLFFALGPEAGEISDLNSDLIEVYEEVRRDPQLVHSLLGRYENTSECYYSARSASPEDAAERAARFIFLNHTSFNGIHRVNRQGKYNVPYGRRKYVRIPDLDHLARAAARLKRVKLSRGDFGEVLHSVRKNDLVFLDPPYTVAHNNNGFVKYNQDLFAYADQERLALELSRIRSLGAHFILCNAAHSSISKLFGDLGHTYRVSRPNSVGGSKALRGNADEFLFTNIRFDDQCFPGSQA